VHIRDVAQAWNAFGEKDAMWAVLTYAGKDANQWDPAEFFATGEADIRQVLDQVEQAGAKPKFGRALDFGCGVGRLTQALGAHFSEVHGVDIAPSMLEKARQFNRHGQRCTFHLNSSDDLKLFPDGHFDFICTLITLQHIEPRYSQAYLREMMRILAPGGTLVFQLPARPTMEFSARQQLKRVTPSALLYLYRRVRYGHVHAAAPDAALQMEMYGTPREDVIRLLTQAGGRVLTTISDQHAGNWIGYRYIVTKS
jgi:ubiquinone/menaquinone biosynthesis C-methylase UbiE